MCEEFKLVVCMGYDLCVFKFCVIMVGVVVILIVGLFYVYYMSFVGFDYMLVLEIFMLWIMFMIGGMGNIVGVIIGVVLV